MDGGRGLKSALNAAQSCPCIFRARMPFPSIPATRGRAMRLLLVVLTASSTGALVPSAALAQRVLGPALDATVLPRGMVRVSIGPEWSRAHERFANGQGRNSRGTVEPLATDFIHDSLGASIYPALGPIRTGLADIIGSPTTALPVTLGPMEARFDASIARTPIVIEFGLTRRITLGAVIPLVKTWTEVSLQPNRDRNGSTVGLNPGWAVPAARTANQLVVTQLQSAAAALAQLLQQCTGSGDPSCTAVNANRTRAQALVTAAGRAATGIESVYGTSPTNPGNRFAPTDSSVLQRSIAQRLGALDTEFAGFLGAAPSGSWVSARPVGAAPFSWGDLQRSAVDTSFGIRGDSLISIGMNRLGDIELGGRFLVFDGVGGTPQVAMLRGLRLRLAVEGLVRFGTGTRDSIDNFVDIGTGDGQRDLEGRVLADLVMGRKAWATIAARYTVQQEDQIRLRVPQSAVDPLPLASRTTLLQRDLGDAVSLEVSPRYVMSDNVALAFTWQAYRKRKDAYGSTAGLDAQVLEAGSAQQVQRATATLTYSTLARYYQRQARLPMEVSFSIGRTLAGSGNALKQSMTAVTMRVYNQLLEGSR